MKAAAASDSALAQIAAALKQDLRRAMDLFREWDVNGDGAISKREFKNAMATLKIEVTAEGVDALFRQFDGDGQGTIDFKELNKLVRLRSRPPSTRTRPHPRTRTRPLPRCAHRAVAAPRRSRTASQSKGRATRRRAGAAGHRHQARRRAAAWRLGQDRDRCKE